MQDKERIALYISRAADKEVQTQTENMLLRDTRLLQAFIKASEDSICRAPSGFAAMVMGAIRLQGMPAVSITMPVISTKLCAAACFCSAAAIMLFSLPGFQRQVFELLFSHFGRLSEFMNLLKF